MTVRCEECVRGSWEDRLFTEAHAWGRAGSCFKEVLLVPNG